VGCGRCGAPLDEGDLFCGDCGAPVSAGCPTCGEPLTPGKRFCRRCGGALFEAAPAPAAGPQAVPKSAAERRMCSVLFCDVVGFTPGAAAHAASAIAEARAIAGRLRCQPLLDRADALTPRDPVTATPQDSPRAVR